ncbi:M57 family metalloprotease [Myxococcus guangdongensis]|uniref:M57 family metalloprotease n=1 Tax=Myxococcus guangdongensis TaxID=2906760 RepID=UPI002B1ED5F0|nr:M57 family metalloprotease [Myxococcus guangdongensis]
MSAKSLVIAMGCAVLLLGCDGAPQESQEIVGNLLKAGFPADDIMVVEGKVYAGRDAEVTLSASREMLEPGDSRREQYRTTNLISASLSKICVNAPAFTGVFSTALDMALANYNALSLTFTLARAPSTGCGFTINAFIDPNMNGGVAGFPSNGVPYGQMTIGGLLSQYGVDVIEHVITHELGHTLGFRHSDYYNRAISCGSGGNEGDAGVGAIHIPGTPTTATVGGSIMNSCFRSVETGEFTSSDLTALNALYAPASVCKGQTPQGATAWQQYDTNGIYLDVNTSSCGFGSTPLYFTSLGGNSSHWQALGATSIYNPTATGFRVFIYLPGLTTTQANSWGWHLNWQATPNSLRQPSLCTGQTPQGTTSWQQYDANGIYLDVNTSGCGFGSTPLYFTSLGGNSSHWTTTGATSIYSPTATGFRVYVFLPGVTTTQANSWGWHLNWQASPTDLRHPSFCTGQTPQGNTAWQQYDANGIYLDVNSADCALGTTPQYFTSLGGNSTHWTSAGATSIYIPSPTGFRVFVFSPGITVPQAHAFGWHLNWSAR